MNIDYTALQKTKEACHEELDMIVNKYNTHHLQTIYESRNEKSNDYISNRNVTDYTCQLFYE